MPHAVGKPSGSVPHLGQRKLAVETPTTRRAVGGGFLQRVADGLRSLGQRLVRLLTAGQRRSQANAANASAATGREKHLASVAPAVAEERSSLDRGAHLDYLFKVLTGANRLNPAQRASRTAVSLVALADAAGSTNGVGGSLAKLLDDRLSKQDVGGLALVIQTCNALRGSPTRFALERAGAQPILECIARRAEEIQTAKMNAHSPGTPWL